jgi:hypothetical protein
LHGLAWPLVQLDVAGPDDLGVAVDFSPEQGPELLGRAGYWIAEGLGAFEASLSTDPETGRFCHGDAPDQLPDAEKP